MLGGMIIVGAEFWRFDVLIFDTVMQRGPHVGVGWSRCKRKAESRRAGFMCAYSFPAAVGAASDFVRHAKRWMRTNKGGYK